MDDAFYTLVKDLLYNPMEGSYLRELAETLNTELWVEQRLAGAPWRNCIPILTPTPGML